MTTTKCEKCGTEAPAKPWPLGWIQAGMSKYGKQYHAAGIAWWCLACRYVMWNKPATKEIATKEIAT